jgi:hypothetical protein
LEHKTLIDPTAGSDRTLMKEYRDFPREIDTLRPFCFHEEDTLVSAFPSPNRASEEQVRMTAYNTEQEAGHWIIKLAEMRDRIITLEDRNTSTSTSA